MHVNASKVFLWAIENSGLNLSPDRVEILKFEISIRLI
jgi:hypothetical protein